MSLLQELILKTIENKDFLNVGDFITPNYKCLVFITYKGTGKTYSIMKKCIQDAYNNGEQFVWVRNTLQEISVSMCANSFIDIIYELGLESELYVKNLCVYRKFADKEQAHQLLGTIIYASKFYNFSSQNALNKTKYVVYDEFINPNFNLKNLFSDFMKAAHTALRKQQGYIILLGNKHESDNDILNELGVEFDWERNENQFIERPEQLLFACYLTKWEIKKMNATNEMIDLISRYSPSMKKFSSGNISQNNMYSVKNWETNGIKNIFSAKFNYDLNDTRYTFGYVNDSGNNVAYIKQNDYSKEFNVPTYCYRPSDKKSDNYLILDNHDLDSVEIMLTQYAQGNLFFSSAFAKGEFEYLLVFLKTLKIS